MIPDRGQGPNPGFSLIELIIVISIMAVLAGIAVPTVDILQTRARSDRTVDQMEALETALDEFFLTNFRYPDLLADLETEGHIVSSFGAGDAFLDGWGNGFTYEEAGESAVLSSFGPDQIDSTKNIVLNLDGRRILRAETRKNMETVHLALQLYQSERSGAGLPLLPSIWYDSDPTACAMGILVENGYLANDVRYRSDAWSEDFSYMGSPGVHLTSANM